MLAEPWNQAHQESRRAESALQRMRFMESLLQWMQLSVAVESLHRRQLVPIDLRREDQAGADCGAVEQDRTGATDPMFAADVRAGKSELLAQEVAQQEPWLDGASVRDSIDGDTDGVLTVHREAPEGLERMAEPAVGVTERAAGREKRSNDTPEQAGRKGMSCTLASSACRSAVRRISLPRSGSRTLRTARRLT